MISKISKTDWWVIIGFWIMAAPIIVSDYISDMPLSKAIQMMSLDMIIITFVSLTTVYYLAAKHLTAKKYFLFLAGLFCLLLIQSFLYYLGYVIIWSMKTPDSWLEFIADEIVSGGD